MLRRFEYFGQYGEIHHVTINKEKAFQSENQGLCYSAYLTYSSEKEASIAILSID
jgi:CCR4-NOT transcription complex subunit 4